MAYGVDAAGVDDVVVLVGRVHVLGGHGGTELYKTLACSACGSGGKSVGISVGQPTRAIRISLPPSSVQIVPVREGERQERHHL
jgi:hypothetical protein